MGSCLSCCAGQETTTTADNAKHDPTPTSHTSSTDTNLSTLRVDVNTCSSLELENFKGVGPKTAQKLIENRPYRNVEEVLKITGRIAPYRDLLICGNGFKQEDHGPPPKVPAPFPATSNTTSKTTSNTTSNTTTFLRQSGTRLIVGSWNVRALSHKKSAQDLGRIASVISRFHIVALQEVRDDSVCTRLIQLLPGGSSSWDFRCSRPIGRGKRNQANKQVYEERYAFFWQTAACRLVRDPVVIGDSRDLVVREPFVAYFKAIGVGSVSMNAKNHSGGFDFVIATVHVVFGQNKDDRVKETAVLARMLKNIERAVAPEHDILLVGDFNLPPADCPFANNGYTPLIRQPNTTTIYRSLYDNIWISKALHTSFTRMRGDSGVMHIDHEYFPETRLPYKSIQSKNARKECNKSLSDHRPIWASFSANHDDDSDINHNMILHLSLV
eukprot:m.112170 g.112170  ORF g.112170 m.112170 type:complete len:441 (-) comp28174_c0_seq1:62-1384(-)